MPETKIHILSTCLACQGHVYLPIGQAISSSGEPYTQYAPCPTCQGSGLQARWISLEVLVRLLADCPSFASTLQPGLSIDNRKPD